MVTIKEWEKVFKALGQHLRLRIIALLAEQELCVCELEEILGITQPAISQHLRVLKEADLVGEEKVSQWVFYHLNKEKLATVLQGWLAYLDVPLATKKEFAADYDKLQQLLENPKVACRPPQKRGGRDGAC
ncbi:metalloregulator ArsR/SmtB family transcription factor [Moorella naiadis]|uniref:ArsR/SmtB family transcription factor n=1 Tax=Moorella naiadis (nom. illeg.) TaxID=3093670 RepID=UPI003D9CAEB5